LLILYFYTVYLEKTTK